MGRDPRPPKPPLRQVERAGGGTRGRDAVSSRGLGARALVATSSRAWRTETIICPSPPPSSNSRSRTGPTAAGCGRRSMAERPGSSLRRNASPAQRPDALPVHPSYEYARRLAFYRGATQPEDPLRDGDHVISVAPLAYALGNWHMACGDNASASAMCQPSVASGGWWAFGFIVSEVELERMRRRLLEARLDGRRPGDAQPRLLPAGDRDRHRPVRAAPCQRRTPSGCVDHCTCCATAVQRYRSHTRPGSSVRASVSPRKLPLPPLPSMCTRPSLPWV